MTKKGKYLLDQFQKHLESQFKEHCQTQKVEPSFGQLITFIIDQNMLSNKVINGYTIRKEFELLYPDHGFHKTDTINTLSIRFNLSERTIWNVLRSEKK